ncbi:hypothetical protein DL766_007090 [Monosporascus sp. MC13-8B]|uniref:Uncharacterized protein n=1 Tax=Monosporascus cannonballus TaxID=155416 RepID=A0ABY0GRW8_9PEZI|nr:hypothetical protein DL762_010118 [Monosporascus cannonballus]RYO89955.1 hypothetical protein DL763_005511 [Monosporascus cannonballus]RYP25371.1 hypothetical protein DL766_007090 [Monosporascus sp. MC13-8B]
MQSFDNGTPTEQISSPPMAASSIKVQKMRQSISEGLPLSHSEISLPYRRSRPSSASLYASTLSPPGSRPQSPIGRPSSVRMSSVFGAPTNNALALTQGAGHSPGDPLNLILKAFAPHVAVYTSEDTDILMREKGFERGLWELLRPFGERVQGKVVIRDSNGSSRTYEDYSIHFVRFGEDIEHPEPITGGLRNADPQRFNRVPERQSAPARWDSKRGGNLADVEAVVERHLRGTQSVATDDDSVPLPRSEWMAASEEVADIKRSEDEEDFEAPSKYIFESDATAIRTFIREMVMQSIVPTMERHVSVWNDQVASRRRGVAGRFLGLTKRWGFGSSSRSSLSGPSSGSNYEPLGFYRADTPEAIMRKLADYAFMLRDWKLAYSTYDLLRGDFNNDKAWKYHAAANEMAAISLLITPQNISAKTRAETIDAMLESAVYSYLTRCSAPYGATRCLVLALELLRLRGGSSIDDAAKWGIRLLESRILGPVGDGLIKERLAVCYASKQGRGTRFWGGRRRKSALWCVLGAEAWVAQSKFIQSQRCLNEARNMYAELPTEHGIDKFELASAFMLGIGQQLNQHLEADEPDYGPGSTVYSEVVDEESEAFDPGAKRTSVLGRSGATATGLETAPLRSSAPEEEERDPGGAKDDFG